MSATPSTIRLPFRTCSIRLIKVGVSLAYLFCQFTVGRMRRLFSAHPSGTCVVLYYHTVPDTYRDRFEEQMRMVSKLSRTVALDSLDRFSANTHSAAITFDDGLESFARNAIPILEKANVPATVFVVPDALGCKPCWAETYYDPQEIVMSKEQLLGLPALISVGSHTLTHPDLVKLSEQAAAHEIAESRRKLESLLQRPVTTFSFPHGEFNSSLVDQCRQAGYERVFTISPAVVRGSADYVVGRVAADPWDWNLEFRLKILGSYGWLVYLKSAKRRIMQLFSRRDITNTSNSMAVRPVSHS